MYTEIKEAVAFLFRYYRNNSARRRVALLMTEFANLLILKYRNNWDIIDPTNGEDFRKIDLFRKDGDRCMVDKLFYTACEVMYFMEVIESGRTPEITIFINPGSVYYKCNKQENSPPVEIWRGDVIADTNYNPMPLGAISSRISPPKSYIISTGKSIYLSGDAKNVHFNESEDPNPLVLHLQECHPTVNPSPLGVQLFQFVFYAKEHKPVSVAKFAQTRFGSSKIRPDHENMRRLQHAAAAYENGNIGNMLNISYPGQPVSAHPAHHHFNTSSCTIVEDEREQLMRSFFPL